MSTGSSARKPPADIYTVFLAVALLALIVAVVFLYLETNSTEYGSPPYGALPRLGPSYQHEFRLAGLDRPAPLGDNPLLSG